MKLTWSRPALADLVRLHDFLEPVAPRAADAVVKDLNRAALRLRDFPRVGMRVEHYSPREVRRIIVGAYELRYEVIGEEVFVVRVWHGREDR
ncbi:MAG: type II toxin-antitoxin system RelE/ParE family toxin [Caulobacterales bacterium]